MSDIQVNNLIGWHTGTSGPGLNDWVDKWARPLLDAGQPLHLKSVNNTGRIKEAIDLNDAAGTEGVIVLRFADIPGMPDNPSYDNPGQSARDMWAVAMDYIGRAVELGPYKGRYVLELGNEGDKGRFEVMCTWALTWFELSLRDGVPVAVLGINSGEPEYDHWRGDLATEMLRMLAAHPDHLFLSVHEYKLLVNRETGQHYGPNEPLDTFLPFTYGRHKWINDRADELGIARPSIIVSEAGWHYRDAANETRAKLDLEQMTGLYGTSGNVRAVFLWNTEPGWGSLDTQCNALMSPLVQSMLGYLPLTVTLDPGGAEPGDPPTEIPDELIVNTDILLAPPAYDRVLWAPLLDEIANAGRTNTESAHNAAALALLAKLSGKRGRVIVVDPHMWQDSITEWLDGYGVDYEVRILNEPDDPDGPGDDPDFAGLEWPVRPLDASNVSTTDPWPGGWHDVTGFLTWYRLFTTGRYAYHTGADLHNNRPGPNADYGAPLYAIASGTIIWAVDLNVWGKVLVLKFKAPAGATDRNGQPVEYMYARYAHLKDFAGHAQGDVIERGTVIAHSGTDASGNLNIAHLHFDISNSNVLETNPGHWPGEDRTEVVRNYVDPGLWLTQFGAVYVGGTPPFSQPGAGRLGIHLSADPGGFGEDRGKAADMAPDVIKYMSAHDPNYLNPIIADHPAALYVMRLFLHWGGRSISPAQFVQWTETDARRNWALVDGRERLIEIHNEPNLTAEGLGYSWADGAEFNAWYLDVLGRYRAIFPGARFLFPGLSPGGAVPGIKADSWRFIEACRPAIEASDGLACHVYWATQAGWPMSRALDELVQYRQMFGNKPLYVTEFANNRGGIEPAAKAVEYINFATEARLRGVEAMTAFVLSASDQTWLWPPAGIGDPNALSYTGQVLTTEMCAMIGAR